MDKLQEEYLTVKLMLEKYTPYTHGIERALDLLEQQKNEIEHLHSQIRELRSEITVLNSIRREGN